MLRDKRILMEHKKETQSKMYVTLLVPWFDLLWGVAVAGNMIMLKPF